MRKIVIALACLLFSASVYSNPLLPPPVISELYWDDSGWTMELYFLMAPYDIGNLDELLMVVNDDTSAFSTSIPIELWQIMLITNDDLVTPIDIPVEGGLIDFLLVDYDLFPINEGFAYGNHPYSRVTAVEPGQSLVTQKFITIDERGMEFWLVKEMQPSIGSLPFTCQTRADFSGLVVDKAGLPVPDASIIYTYTDTENFDPPIPGLITGEDGAFSTDQMFCKEYNIGIFVDGGMELITQLNIEPGSANYFEFALDSLYVGKNEFTEEPKISMTTNPNPFTNDLHVNIQVNGYKSATLAQLKLMDLNGKVIKGADINASYLHHMDVYWNNMNQIIMNPGVYILVLEVDGRVITSQKVIFQQ